MRYTFYVIATCLGIMAFTSSRNLNVFPIWSAYQPIISNDPTDIDNNNPGVADLMVRMGMENYIHKLPQKNSGESVSAKKGKDLFFQGFTETDRGKHSNRISAYFTCNACHNTVQEDPNLLINDPEARLNYAIEKDIPFLPGTTMYGVINRESYYNDDYIKKYGDLVTSAKHDLRAATQLCAQECSSGRKLEKWELESLIAYFWQIQLRLNDLELDPQKKAKLANLAKDKEVIDSQYAQFLRNGYLLQSNATFADPPPNRREGNDYKGRPKVGAELYKRSCLHCHKNARFAFFELSNSKLDIRFLEKHLFQYDRYSVYQVVRYGTSPIPGKRSYMPLYPLQRLNRQQMADLRTFVLTKGS